MSWQKIDCKKRIVAPDGLSFIYPDELYVNGQNDEFLYLHQGKYYIATQDTQYKLKWSTNSEALFAKYEQDPLGSAIAYHCIENEQESLLIPFLFKNDIAYKLKIPFLSSKYESDYIIFKYDNEYRMRLESLCDGRDFQQLHAKYYWDELTYDPEFNPTTFRYLRFPDQDVIEVTISNNNRSINNPYGGDLFFKTTGLNSGWSIDYDDESSDPPALWDEINTEYNLLRFKSAYVAIAQVEYNINSNLVVYNLFESNTLLGKYTALDTDGEVIERTVGWLKFKDTESKEYTKQFTIYEDGGVWYAQGNELSNEPTEQDTATYTIKDENGNDKIVTVSFGSYTAYTENLYTFTTNGITGDEYVG